MLMLPPCFYKEGGKKQHKSISKKKKKTRRTNKNVNYEILTSQDGQQIFRCLEPNSPAQEKVALLGFKFNSQEHSLPQLP